MADERDKPDERADEAAELAKTAPLDPDQMAALRARAAKVEAALSGKTLATARMSLTSEARAKVRPATPFRAGTGVPPEPATAIDVEIRGGDTVSAGEPESYEPATEPERASQATLQSEHPTPRRSFGTPAARIAARDLGLLMTTEDSELARYRDRHAVEGRVDEVDLARMRDLLHALSDLLQNGDADGKRRIYDAWRILHEEPRKLGKR